MHICQRSEVDLTHVITYNFYCRYAFIDPLVVLENVGDAAVEIESYSYELYLITRDFVERYKLAEGETYLLMDSGGVVIGPGASRDLYLISQVDLRRLSSAAVEPLKNPREFRDMKFFYLRISTYE